MNTEKGWESMYRETQNHADQLYIAAKMVYDAIEAEYGTDGRMRRLAQVLQNYEAIKVVKGGKDEG